VDIFGFDKSLAKEAVRIYRKRYAEVGIHKATIYDGFEDMLIFFKNSGYKIGLATLKAEIFAKTMLDEMGILEYFDAICGANAADELDKNELILKCKKMCAVDNKEIVMVGDSKNDAVGAMQCGCDFIAVTYGFGFKKMDELDDYPNIGVCSSVAEIQNLFLI
jgi:phosphoglycolate phosphatase